MGRVLALNCHSRQGVCDAITHINLDYVRHAGYNYVIVASLIPTTAQFAPSQASVKPLPAPPDVIVVPELNDAGVSVHAAAPVAAKNMIWPAVEPSASV